MSTITIKDGNQIYYKEWGSGHPQPAPLDRRRLGGHPPRRRSPPETGPPDRRRGGQATRGTPGVGAAPGTPSLAPAEGDLGQPSGPPPRTDPAGRHSVIFLA